jgi:hypothetical protein
MPPWCGSLRQAGFISAAAGTIYHPIRGITLIGVIGIVDGGSWGQGPHSRGWYSFSVSDILLVHLLFFFIGVAEDDDLAVAEDDDLAVVEQPKDITVEVAEEFLVNSSSREV